MNDSHMEEPLTLSYDSRSFFDDAWHTIRARKPFDVVITGFSAKKLSRAKRLGKFFRNAERPKLSGWERVVLSLQGLLTPSFWAIYFYAVDKGMTATWIEHDHSILIRFSKADRDLAAT
jgi:hypothetical protein